MVLAGRKVKVQELADATKISTERTRKNWAQKIFFHSQGGYFSAHLV